MRNAAPSPEQARREYWKIRDREISAIKFRANWFSIGGGMWGNTNARNLLDEIRPLENLIRIILSHKDEIYISKQVMKNLLEDQALLAQLRAKAEKVLNK